MNVPTRIKMAVRSLVYKDMGVSLDRALLVTDHVSSGYFHWVADVLPKVVLMREKHPQKCLDVPILLPHSYNKPYCLATLQLLGVSEKDILIIPRGYKVRVRELYAAGDLASPRGSGNYRPALMQQIRRAVHSALRLQPAANTDTGLRRLYISRADAAYRFLANEMELSPLLNKFGFKIITASSISIAQQAALFAGADIVVSLHGAGLVNMMWMREGAAVGEIRRKNDAHNNCYFSLASALNVAYWYAEAEADSSNTQRANFMWDIASAQEFLERITAI